MNHYMVPPKTKRIKCLAISQTTLGTKVDSCSKRLYVEFQIKLVFGFKENNISHGALRYWVMDHERY